MSEAASILLLHGTDELAIRERVQKLRSGLDPATADMNLSRLDGRAVSYEDLNTAVCAIPFLSPIRLVVLTNASALPREMFIRLLDQLPPTTRLAIVEPDSLRSDHWLLKWAAKAGSAVEVRQLLLPRLKDMPGWLVSEAKKQKGAIVPAAAARLAEMVGEDTRQAAGEITKLLTYVDFQRPVTVADVEAVSLASAQGSVFELVDALGNRDGKKAQKTLHRLLEDEDPFALWGMVIRQFRLLLEAREILEERGGPLDVQKQLGLQEFVAGKITAQAKRFSLPVLEDLYHQLLEIDERAKTGQVPLDLALDVLVVELTGK